MESEAKAETTEQAEQRGFGDWSENNRGFVCVNDAVGPNRESSGKWAEVIVGWILAVLVNLGLPKKIVIVGLVFAWSSCKYYIRFKNYSLFDFFNSKFVHLLC